MAYGNRCMVQYSHNRNRDIMYVWVENKKLVPQKVQQVS